MKNEAEDMKGLIVFCKLTELAAALLKGILPLFNVPFGAHQTPMTWFGELKPPRTNLVLILLLLKAEFSTQLLSSISLLGDSQCHFKENKSSTQPGEQGHFFWQLKAQISCDVKPHP